MTEKSRKQRKEGTIKIKHRKKKIDEKTCF